MVYHQETQQSPQILNRLSILKSQEETMLGIIGGSGLYQLEGLQIDTERTLTTPFGVPSSAISCGEYNSQPVAFLARHGSAHKLLPHEINYRANI